MRRVTGEFAEGGAASMISVGLFEEGFAIHQ